MKLLFLDSPSFGKLDLIDAFEQLGFTVQLFNHEKLHEYWMTLSTTLSHRTAMTLFSRSTTIHPFQTDVTAIT